MSENGLRFPLVLVRGCIPGVYLWSKILEAPDKKINVIICDTAAKQLNLDWEMLGYQCQYEYGFWQNTVKAPAAGRSTNYKAGFHKSFWRNGANDTAALWNGDSEWNAGPYTRAKLIEYVRTVMGWVAADHPDDEIDFDFTAHYPVVVSDAASLTAYLADKPE
jgi:hypothetical protein